MQGQRFKASKPARAPHPNLGGWRGAPASVQALADNRWNIARSRRCAKCNQPALSTRQFCRRHAGRGAADVQPSPGRAARRELLRLRRRGLIPEGLLRLGVFGATAFGPMRLAPVALVLVHAWDNRDNDPGLWCSAVRQARRALA